MNYAGATVSGLGLGILIDDSATGPAPFATSITNLGTISGGTSFAIRLIGAQADYVYNEKTISGGGGTAISMGDGADRLVIGTGSVITGISDGGLGTDRLEYNAYGSAVTVNLATGAATGTGGVTGFEHVIGSAFRDVLTGSSGADTLAGGADDDTIRGGNGADSLSGGADGDFFDYYSQGEITGDTIDGGTGLDRLYLNVAGSYDFSGVSITSIERLVMFGGSHAGTFGAAQVGAGLASNLEIQGDSNGTDTVTFANASGTFNLSAFTFVSWTAAVDRIIVNVTGAGADSITGTSQGDTISDTDSNGNDTIDGSGGDDTIVYGGGFNRVEGARASTRSI